MALGAASRPRGRLRTRRLLRRGFAKHRFRNSWRSRVAGLARCLSSPLHAARGGALVPQVAPRKNGMKTYLAASTEWLPCATFNGEVSASNPVSLQGCEISGSLRNINREHRWADGRRAVTTLGCKDARESHRGIECREFWGTLQQLPLVEKRDLRERSLTLNPPSGREA